MFLLVCLDSCDLYLIVLLSLVFSCSNNLLSYWADKVTTGTYNFVSVILKVLSAGLLIETAGLSPAVASILA